MLKQYLILFVFFILTAQVAFADIPQNDDGGWSYAFHFEYANNTLSPDNHSTGGLYSKSEDELYTPIFQTYSERTDPSITEYYGIIINIQGKEVARFGFNHPEATVSILGKSIFNVKAPFFADADRAEFYSKNGKKLFTVSLKGSSFCNDDKKCNADVGENYKNCPYDCPPPPPPVETPPETTPTTTAVAPTVTSTSSGQQIPVTVSQDTNSGNSLIGTPSKTTITLLVLGLLSLILIFILWKLRGFRDE